MYDVYLGEGVFPWSSGKDISLPARILAVAVKLWARILSVATAADQLGMTDR
jgi:HD-GYP domain-containing protein (c-di-GMP phosphodiesterase class II)